MKLLARCALFGVVAALAGCASKAPAPVTERRPPVVVETAPPGVAQEPSTPLPPSPAESRPGVYTVKRGDTLYSIALDHGQSYRDLAVWNSLEDPNKILIGQQLRVTPPEAPAPVAVTRPVSVPSAVEVRPLTPSGQLAAPSNSDKLKHEPRALKRPYSEEALAALRKADAAYVATPPEPAAEEPKAESRVEAKPPSEEDVDWAWPAGGRLLNGFVEGSNKGIDIAAKSGDPVLAAASGRVVYAGSGLRGYGKLVIVKHNAVFLSAYAHNSQLLVKEGQAVQKGQKIAEAGASDADQPMLHFEIRRQGKPVDPLKQLPGR